MAPFLATGLWDPTLLFMGSCLFSPLVLVGDAGTQSLSFRALSELPVAAAGFFADWAWLVFLAYLLVAHLLVRRGAPSSTLCPPSHRTSQERRTLGWYLWNGAICHLMMDGLAGGGWALPLMIQNYEQVDRRFRQTSQPGERASAMLLMNIELVGHSSLCLMAYVGTALRRPWRHEVQILTLSLQLMGTIMFVVPEFMTECLNLAPQGVATCAPVPTLYNLVYFWFGTCISFIWFVIPLRMLWGSICESVALKSGKDLKQ
eukprot:CAMPEP_0204190086 /NCGR_PEP_ID=MMETSP0361-20130328/59026_1 /ASSEMBLY_ACC=CAM_ASM_000343 /TAXON_ID=268821 /ORGANISM="Scrippsiella Hangoei, Strain SHTV-5" /LENGTH=259 /DNA_ID=CAMNT_0051150851 /DNA_START=35 /DNA_END=814 /DNA_ORIENTATION=+